MNERPSASPQRPMRDYSVFGLRLRSDLALPELHACADAGEPDVVVAEGSVAAPEEEGRGYEMLPGGTRLSVAEAGRFWIAGGDRITYQRLPGASEKNLRLFLLGSALGALLHQRGLLPLHANAIEVAGRAVAFMGHSGAGKSTIAAWFHDRGYPVLADDVCVVTFAPDGTPLAHGGIPRLRLWREALEASGRDAGAFEPSFDDMDKYDVPTPQREALPAPLPIDRIYLLGKAEGEAGSIQRLEGVAAVEALVANTYRGAHVGLAGATQTHLAACLRLVAKAPVFSAARAWGYDRFDVEARRLEAHAVAPLA